MYSSISGEGSQSELRNRLDPDHVNRKWVHQARSALASRVRMMWWWGAGGGGMEGGAEVDEVVEEDPS